jgi:hypothetical protein
VTIVDGPRAALAKPQHGVDRVELEHITTGRLARARVNPRRALEPQLAASTARRFAGG